MSYYSDNDWRYYSEDYLEHASLRDKWNDLMSKTAVDDKIKGAYEGAKNAVGRKVEAFKRSDTGHTLGNAVKSAKAGRIGNAARSVGTAASRGAVNAFNTGVGKVRNMFGLTNAFPDGKNSEEYNRRYYERFKERILAKQKEYRQRLRNAVDKSENKVDDRILGAVDKAVSGARYGLRTAGQKVRVGADLMRRNPKVVLNQGVKNVKNAAGRAYDSAREAAGNVRDTARNLRDAAGNAYDSARDTVANGVNRFIDATPTNWDNNLRDSYNRRKTVKAGSQRRNSNRG